MGNKLKLKGLQIRALEVEHFEVCFSVTKGTKYSGDIIYISVTTNIAFM